MDLRVKDLNDNFAAYVRVFGDSNNFSGPSVCFCQKAVRLRRRLGRVADAIDSDDFIDLAYATLTAWGMHRMGPTKTKLRELSDITGNLRQRQTRSPLLRWKV